MDDPLGGGGVISEEVDVRHDVVAEAALVLGGLLEVECVEVRPHLVERFVRYRDAQLRLRLCEGEPESAPRAEASRGGEDSLHLLRCVAIGEGVDVTVEIGAHRASRADVEGSGRVGTHRLQLKVRRM